MIRFFIIILFLLTFSACAQKGLLLNPVDLGQTYFYKADLREMQNDRVPVKLEVYQFNGDEAVFNFPRIVPGIYGAMDFGRNIVNFKALADGGDTLPAERLGVNSWKIRNARKLREIRYEVNDGWDEFGSGTTEGFYKSAESSFTRDQVFVINHNCLFGYFTGGEKWPVYVDIEKPEYLYGATSLINDSKKPGLDEFHAANYRELVDHPILYARPDTARLDIGGIAVTIACYANSGNKLAAGMARKLRPLLENQRRYLGDSVGVDHYTFLFYHALNSRPNDYTGDGLEHSTSTLCLFNSQLDSSVLNGFFYDIASHEFFHIVTPLTVHSEEIENYDFLAPKMSQHLWLYEGMTEYATMHMPVKQGMTGQNTFLETIQRKVRQMQQFDSRLPLTELSRSALERQDQYYNVYLRGALVCMCLDIRLRELSAGKYGTQELMRDLSTRFGKNKPFRDEELFDVIAGLTYPEIRTFFRDYVESAQPLPLAEYLAKAGFEFSEKSFRVKPAADPTPAQLQLRKWWIGER